MKPDKCVLLGVGVAGGVVGDGNERSVSSSLMVSVAKALPDGPLKRVARIGKALISKISPERRMGSVLEYFSVKISRASVKIGVVEGVYRVRGWMVSQSMLRLCGFPITVSMKSIVFLSTAPPKISLAPVPEKSW